MMQNVAITTSTVLRLVMPRLRKARCYSALRKAFSTPSISKTVNVISKSFAWVKSVSLRNP